MVNCDHYSNYVQTSNEKSKGKSGSTTNNSRVHKGANNQLSHNNINYGTTNIDRNGNNIQNQNQYTDTNSDTSRHLSDFNDDFESHVRQTESDPAGYYPITSSTSQYHSNIMSNHHHISSSKFNGINGPGPHEHQAAAQLIHRCDSDPPGYYYHKYIKFDDRPTLNCLSQDESGMLSSGGSSLILPVGATASNCSKLLSN